MHNIECICKKCVEGEKLLKKQIQKRWKTRRDKLLEKENDHS